MLHSFTGISGEYGGDGQLPAAGLIFDAAGALYGTTEHGGGSGYGTVFKLTPPTTSGGAWIETILFSFAGPYIGGGDGAYPEAGLISDASGALYGTTVNGGTECSDGGCGTVFKLTPPVVSGGAWTESLLYKFTSSDGSPHAGLIFDSSGALYGTTLGTVFKLTPPANSDGARTESVLHLFGSGDGLDPYAGLIFDASGALYGTTFHGGTTNGGTIFKLTPPTISGGAWTETVLYSFNNNTSSGGGAVLAAGLIFDAAGALYGTTQAGGADEFGTIFKLTPPASKGGAWTERVLHSFTGTGGDGQFPDAGLILDTAGALYGTTSRAVIRAAAVSVARCSS